ncbi:hypothetical protein [Kitasatospora sp. NPDC058218]|uniref:hypothetical protein n=1 Tax=Kitasatospora sp. NPDC058218 TaxID=3346385 RepID=UPI0036DAC3E8
MSAVLGVALADFRDRVRRPAYLVVLLAALGLGLLAVPPADSHWVILQIGDRRGRYTGAYVGLSTALAGTLWLTLGGFHLVRGSLERDDRSGVGRLLAATALRSTAYLAGKLLSGVLLLASVLGALAATALVLQLVRGESRSLDLPGLLLPFLVITLPATVLTVAAALLFDTLPVLRGGFGNILWFFGWLAVAVGGQGAGLPLGGLGVHQAVASARADLAAQQVDIDGEFSLGFTYVEQPLRVFDWNGFSPDGSFLLGRLALVVLAVAVAVLPALWFDRFDPDRAGSRPRRAADPATVDWAAPAALPSTPTTPGRLPALRLLVGEVRILLHGVAWWWWAGVALITLAALVATGDGAIRVVLPLAWIWPVLLWSRLGTRPHEYGVAALLAALPRPVGRSLAPWAAGVLLTGITGVGPLLALARDGDLPGLASWVAAVLFIPALAIALGTLSRTHRLFQAVYLPLWYVAANGLPFLDFMAATRAPGQPAPVPAVLLSALAALLLAVAVRRSASR